jgi:beta-lactamase class A
MLIGRSGTGWRTPAVLLAFACLLSRPSLLFAQDANLAEATQQIEKRISESHADVGVVFRTLDGKSAWTYHTDDSFHAASTMKLPVMIELFHQVREGKLRLDDPLTIRNEFHSIVDGSVYKLDPKDDSDTELYQAEGQTRTLSQLCELMITMSSNLATNLLIEKLGVENIRNTVHSLGADGMNVCEVWKTARRSKRG